MGQNLARDEIQEFLEQLAKQYTKAFDLYLLGGSALCFLGSQRRTVDIDCTIEAMPSDLEAAIRDVSQMLQLEVEVIPIDEFIPLPPATSTRHQSIGKFGSISVFVYDPYSIALSKIARGFETDIQDVGYLLKQGTIDMTTLTGFVEQTLPEAWDYDIDPNEMRDHFHVVKQLFS
jgi:hypothetical protein